MVKQIKDVNHPRLLPSEAKTQKSELNGLNKEVENAGERGRVHRLSRPRNGQGLRRKAR